MDYRETPPTHPLVRQYVASFWAVTAQGPLAGERAVTVVDLPDGHTEYLFNGSAAFLRHVVTTPEVRTVHSSLLCAPKRRASVLTITGPTDLFCIRFKPFGLFGLSGEALHEISDQAVDPCRVFPARARELEERILTAGSFAERVSAAETVLGRCPCSEKAPDSLVVSAIDLMRKTNGRIRVRDIASRSNASRRSLEMKFREQIGLSVKDLARMYRFNHFWTLRGRSRDEGLLRLALDCGFFDQSHFIREFRFFTGSTPTSLGNLGPDLVKHSLPDVQFSRIP